MNLKRTVAAIGVFVSCAAVLLGSAGCKKNADPQNNDEYTPSSGLVMTSAQADSLANSLSVKLYFMASPSGAMVSETALLEYKQADKKISHLAASILEKLLAGPSNVKLLTKVVPDGTEIKNVSFKNGKLTVDVNTAFVSGLPEDLEAAKFAVYSIVNTLTEIKDIEQVVFTCEGNTIEPLSCGFVFGTFSRDLSMVRGDTETGTAQDPYAEELFEGVPLE